MVVKHSATPIVTSEQPSTPAITPSANPPLRSTYKVIVKADVSQPSIPAATPPAPLPCKPVTKPTVTEEAIRRHQESGIVVGRAKPHCCLDPKIWPPVRVIFNTKGVLIGYISGKYAKRRVSKGDVQIALKDVDINDEFEKVPAGEQRLKAIRHEVQAKLAVQRQHLPGQPIAALTPKPMPTMTPALMLSARSSPSTDRDPVPKDYARSHQTVMEEGIIVGHAKSNSSRNARKPPVACASLNSKGALVAYIPAKGSIKPVLRGTVKLPLLNIDYTEEFAAMSGKERMGAMKERILQKMIVRKAGLKSEKNIHSGYGRDDERQEPEEYPEAGGIVDEDEVEKLVEIGSD